MLRDLTCHDDGEAPHAVELVVDTIEAALTKTWGVPVHRDPGPRVVTVQDNYDRLRYSADAVTRDARYSRYLGEGRMLRSHTTARVPTLLDQLAAAGDPALADSIPQAPWNERLLSVPGICYRRDVIDRRHVGEPHQLDLWLIRRSGPRLTEDDLEAMVAAVVTALLPGRRWRTVPNVHPYTVAGREIYVGPIPDPADSIPTSSMEVGECGLAHPEVLAGSGLPPTASGLAMGLGLDRLVMLVKGIDDIRLLRSTDPRIMAQLGDLKPYRRVSPMPAARRDLSIAVGDDLDEELLGDRVRTALGADARLVEEIRILSETSYVDLPEAARERMNMRPDQRNLLIRVMLRDLEATLTADRANHVRDRLYEALHEGG
jgi:phenylalanyl-tRNA synthetase alpha chain